MKLSFLKPKELKNTVLTFETGVEVYRGDRLQVEIIRDALTQTASVSLNAETVSLELVELALNAFKKAGI